MANQLYYTIIRISQAPGKGRFELHNSIRRKDLTIGRPDKMAKAIRYHDKISYTKAIGMLSDWRHELEDRFSAIEVDPSKTTWVDKS
jgi:hypothetical protein